MQQPLWLCILQRPYVKLWMPGSGCSCWVAAGLVGGMCSGVCAAQELSLLGL
jgi:hypothetical protein